MNKIALLKTFTEICLNQNDNCIRVQGISMLPLIKENDMVRVEKCNRYKIGDVVVAIDERERILVHRVIKTESEFLIIKGDHALNAEKVDYENCLGRVVEIIREDKTISLRKRTILDRIVAHISKSINKKFLKSNCRSHKEGWKYKLLSYFAKMKRY